MPDMPKPAQERLLVCVSASTSSARLMAAAHEMAGRLQAKWLAVYVGDLSSVIPKDLPNELRVAHAAYESGKIAGWGTQISPATENLYVPLRVADATAGVLALRPRDPARFQLPEQMTLLDSLAKQVALALQVERTSARGRTFPPTAAV